MAQFPRDVVVTLNRDGAVRLHEILLDDLLLSQSRRLERYLDEILGVLLDDERALERRRRALQERASLKRHRRVHPDALPVDIRHRDDVVESVGCGRQFGYRFPPIRIHQRRVCLDAHRSKNRDQEDCLVLAITETALEHDVRIVRNVAAFSHLDAQVADLVLDEPQRRLDARDVVGFFSPLGDLLPERGRQLRFVLDLRLIVVRRPGGHRAP